MRTVVGSRGSARNREKSILGWLKMSRIGITDVIAYQPYTKRYRVEVTQIVFVLVARANCIGTVIEALAANN